MSNLYLENKRRELEAIVSKADAALSARESAVREQETKVRQGLIPNNGASDLKQNLDYSLRPSLVPGNLGNINRVIWPFFFTTSLQTLAVNSSATTRFTVTQEAAFVLMSYTKTVYTKTVGPLVYTYVDPDATGAASQANDLKFSLRDAQSSRDFNNLPINLDQVGNPRWPTILPDPVFFLPNSTIEVTFANSSASVVYVPRITFFGYRVRLENAQQILSTVYG